MDELRKRANKHKKKNKGQGWFTSLNGGDPKVNADSFNQSMGD